MSMLVGVPKEIKDNEYRVGIVPSTVRELTDNGHRVLVATRARRASSCGASFGLGPPPNGHGVTSPVMRRRIKAL
jgi:hypothetical protein